MKPVMLALALGLALLPRVAHAQEFPFAVVTTPYTEFTDGRLFNTVDATPTVFTLYEVAPYQAIYFEIQAMTIVPGFTNAAGGRIRGMCGRNSGNLLCLVAAATLDFTFFSAPQPAMSVQADNADPAHPHLQLVLTGKAATQLGWYLSINGKRTN